MDSTQSVDFQSPTNVQRPKKRECPVCYSTLISPVFQCYHGHIICQNCLGLLDSCPMCREPYDRTRPIRAREFEHLIQEFLMECPYRDRGCDSVLFTEDFDEHKNTCEFKCITTCPRCSNRIAMKILPEHLHDVHSIVGIEKYNFGDLVNVSQTCCLWDFKNSLVNWRSHYIFCGHRKFFLNTNILNGKFICWNVTLEDGDNDESAGQIELKVSFRLHKQSPTGNNVTTTIWNGYASTKPFTDHTNSFSIPLQQLEHYSKYNDDHTRITWSLTFKILQESNDYEDANDETHVPLAHYMQSVPYNSSSIHYLIAVFNPCFDYPCPHTQLTNFRNGVLCIAAAVSPLIIYSLLQSVRRVFPKKLEAVKSVLLRSEQGDQGIKVENKIVSSISTPIDINDYILSGTAAGLTLATFWKLTQWFLRRR